MEYLLLFLVVGLVLLVAIALISAKSSRTTKQAMDRAVQRDESAMVARVDLAGSRLLEADELLRSAMDEVEFARAQFGLSRTGEYATAINQAKSGVAHAFELQQQMNRTPDLAARVRFADQVLATLDQVMPPLVAQHRTFVDLRNAEAGVDEQLAEVRMLVRETEARLPGLQGELDALAVAYPASVIASLQDNPEQAYALVDSARRACDRAEALMSADRSGAVRALETARRALAMASHQINAVLRAQEDLDEADQRLAQAIASITADLSDVTTLHADAKAFAPLVADAQAAVEQGRRARGGGGDPLAALEALTLAEDALDAALAPLRGQTETRAKQSTTAGRRLADATAAVERARAFVQSRRGLVPLEGRSLLTSAESHLTRARSLLTSDPGTSIAESETARALADQVMQTPIGLADATHGRPDGIGAGSLGDLGGNLGSALGGAVLGAVLTGALSKGHFGGFDLDLDGFDFDFD